MVPVLTADFLPDNVNFNYMLMFGTNLVTIFCFILFFLNNFYYNFIKVGMNMINYFLLVSNLLFFNRGLT